MTWDRDVWNAVRDAIFLGDMETGMIVDANPAAEALCGRSLAELRLLHRTGLASAQGILHKDGHSTPVEITASQFTDALGRRISVRPG